MADLIGQTIGQYEITALLGKGGMASVYRARQAKVDRDVAIKIIKADLAESPDFLHRFEREAKTIASLSHPNIVKLFDYGEQDGTLYLVMEILTGGTLDKLIRDKGLSPALTNKQLGQIAAALDYAHSKGIIHRDLKPQNVLLDEGNNAHLTDFGIARLAGATALTKSGAAMGTPYYMSPEQWRGAAIDARSDIYALGIMTYEMLTGIVPFTGDTPLTIMYHHLHDNPPALHTQNPNLPATLDAVIAKAVAKEPDARYQSAEAMAVAVQGALTNSEVVLSGSAAPVVSDHMDKTFSTMDALPAKPTAKKYTLAGGVILIGAIIIVLVIAAILLMPSPLKTAPTPTQIAAAASPDPVTPTIVATVTPNSPLAATPLSVGAAKLSDDQAAATVQAMYTTAGQTLAAQQSYTPTQDIPASYQAVLHVETETAQAVLNLTGTATQWTKTPTSTNTPTMTPTQTPSSTLTNTPTVTASPTPSPTSTDTPQPTATNTVTATLPPTVAPTSTSGVSAKLGGGGGKIAFIRDGDVWWSDVDGQNPVALYTSPSDETVPAWSPDGTQIAFRTNRDKNSEIYVITADPDNPNPRRVTFSDLTESSPGWSPDGAQMIYRQGSSNMDLWSMKPDGSDQHQLTSGTANDLNPRFSHDGKSIVFVSNRSGNYEVYMMNIDGSNLRQITNVGKGEASAYSPDISPDGKFILFYSDFGVRGGRSDVYRINVDGTNMVDMTPNNKWNRYPVWSPDGKYILFTTAPGGVGGEVIYRMNANGVDLVKITQGTQPAWQP